MKRYFILLGDRTTAGGVVIQGDESWRNHGKPLAYHGARISCPACKTVGYICNVPPYRPMTLKGKQIALENDICICKCNPPPRLIASQNNASMSFESRKLAAMGLRPDGSPLPKDETAIHGAFDEQVTLVDRKTGQPLADFPYQFRGDDGTLAKGRTGIDGRTIRIGTSDATNLDLDHTVGENDGWE
ncbi:PAAR domain-containing protein [Burkholderia sp. WAC0059]|uniref:PAAR domain-containing protein n=1 Tax=Burkholderia sp. WAC0059 TaxID=2066022 RepID=UPI000C7F6AD8|nr:PAAR domain-containing protein [Burkholderia sp. WAC0059]PLZ03863.1 PAAR domain-containing protein [Burkholderia sp. WAC0059]